MILDAARLSLANLIEPETRAAFWKSLGLTLALLIGAWFGLDWLFERLAMPSLASLMPGMPELAGWIGFLVGILAAIALAMGLALLVAPATALVAGFFLDDVAEVIERRDYPAEPVGRPLPLGVALGYTVRFLGIVILGNLLALALLLVPGVNIAAFFLVNGYLLGREFFEFAALRYRPEAEVRELRRANATTVFLAGLLIAAFLSVPLVNLLTPLFAAGLMVHLHKMISTRDAARLSAAGRMPGRIEPAGQR